METKGVSQLFEKVPPGRVEVAIRNPIAITEVEIMKPASRPADLNNKKIGLFWNSKARGDVALKKAEAMLKEKFSGLEFSWFRTGNSTALAPKEFDILKEQNNDAIIGTTGD